MAFCTTEMGIYIHLNHKVCSCFYSVFKSSDLRILRWRWNAPLHCHWPTNRLVGSHLNDKAPKYLPHSCWPLCFFYGFCCSWHLNATSGKSSGASPVASSILSCCDGNSPKRDAAPRQCQFEAIEGHRKTRLSQCHEEKGRGSSIRHKSITHRWTCYCTVDLIFTKFRTLDDTICGSSFGLSLGQGWNKNCSCSQYNLP